MAQGKKIQVKLKELIVNPENYRFDPVADEGQALATMMQSLGSEVANLARDIASNGLNPLRTPLSIFKDGHYVVMDGNRRTTALKLLADPDLIKDPYPFKQVFKSLKAAGYKAPDEVEFVVFDESDLDEADRWVYIEHNGQNKGVGTVSWGTKEKARFSARHNDTAGNKALQLTDYLDTKKIDTTGVDQTTLNRILADPVVRAELGVDYVKGTLSIDDEVTALPKIQKVISAMQAKEFNVREVYLKYDRKEWLSKIFPQPTTPPPPPAPKGAKPTGPKPPKVFPGLIDPSESISDKLPKKLIDVHNELIRITVLKTPHATAALTRIYMELLSKEYLISCLGFKEQGDTLVDASGTGNYNELKAKLGEIQNHTSTPKDVKNALRILIGIDLVTQRFNQVMHSQIFFATEPDLRSTWLNLGPVMKHIANEIAKTK